MAVKVLIVDDDVQTLRLVGLMLERQGYKILAANCGTQAIQMAQLEQPEVIILDIMMPDLDGFEVTRQLRDNPQTADIPILMFTAKSQVEDKVIGYEAGADDYLTKPIHPAELTARLRALLARRQARPAAYKARGYTIGVIGPKGGLGVSTLALNLAVAFHQKTKAEVIAAEVRPGQGTWGLELGQPHTDGLSNLLHMRPTDITPEVIENELVRLPYGIRLLMAQSSMKEADLMCCTDQMETLVDHLPLLAKLVLLDLGTFNIPGFDMMLNHCNEVMVVTEPYPNTVQRTRQLIDDLSHKGYGRAKLLSVVSNNRIRADVQLSILQMQEILGMPIAQVIPPGPEIAYQATNRGIPLIQVQIGGVISQQFNLLADRLAQRVPV